MEPSVVIIAPDSFLFKWSKEKEHFYFLFIYLFIFLYSSDSGTRNSKRTPTEGINAISHCSPWHFRLLPKFPEADLSCTLSNEITNVPLTWQRDARGGEYTLSETYTQSRVALKMRGGWTNFHHSISVLYRGEVAWNFLGGQKKGILCPLMPRIFRQPRFVASIIRRKKRIKANQAETMRFTKNMLFFNQIFLS